MELFSVRQRNVLHRHYSHYIIGQAEFCVLKASPLSVHLLACTLREPRILPSNKSMCTIRIVKSSIVVIERTIMKILKI